MIRLTPEFGVDIPPQTRYMDLRERALAACNTVGKLQEHGLDISPCDEDTWIAEQIVCAFAASPEETSQAVSAQNFEQLGASTVLRVNQILDEFGRHAVQNAMRVRYLVQNKLIIESENRDPRVRLRALEMLGKMDDVNMFTEKKEVHTVSHSPEEIQNRLKSKLIELKQGDDGVYEPESA